MADIASLRLDYARARLSPEDVSASPTEQVERWLNEEFAASATR